jgi:hypothetical protein
MNPKSSSTLKLIHVCILTGLSLGGALGTELSVKLLSISVAPSILIYYRSSSFKILMPEFKRC